MRKNEETTAKENQDKDEKDIDSTCLPPPPPIPRDDSNSSILEACGMQEKKPINAETLVFGGTLSKHHVANIEVIKNIFYRSSKYFIKPTILYLFTAYLSAVYIVNYGKRFCLQFRFLYDVHCSELCSLFIHLFTIQIPLG